MRKTFLASAIGLSLVGEPGAAEELVARVTVTNATTRIEIPTERGDFKFEQTGVRTFDLFMTGDGADLDLTALRSDGGAARIASVRTVIDGEANRLRFVLDCDCPASASITRGVIALEFGAPFPIADAEVSKNAPPPASTRRPRPANQSAQAPMAAPTPAPRRERGRLALAGDPQETPAGPDQPSAMTADRAGIDIAEPAANRSEPGQDPDANDRSREVEIARERLLQQLARAADQGLLEFASPEAAAKAPLPPAEEPPEIVTETTEGVSDADSSAVEGGRRPSPEPEPEIEVERPIEFPRPLEIPVRVRTAVDKAFREDRQDTFIAPEFCVDDETLSIAERDGAGAFLDEERWLRENLLDQYDDPSPAGASSLARFYISKGLGVEALETLSAFGEDSQEKEVLSDLAMIVEGRRPAPQGPIARSGTCSGAAALWFYAADFPTPLPDPASKDTEEMIAVFSEMSPRLRALIGPQVVISLLNAGDVTTADAIDGVVRRTAVALPPMAEIAAARLASAQGRSEDAAAAYAAIASGVGPFADEALARLVDEKLTRGERVPRELVDRLEEAAFVNRANSEGRRLKRLAVRANAAADGLPAALAMVSRQMKEHPDETSLLQDAAHAALESAQAEDVGELAYARATLSFAQDLATTRSADAARIKIAEELIVVGLANAAFGILQPALDRDEPRAKLVAAKAHLVLGDAELAFVTVEGLDGPEAAALRAEAAARLGQTGSAQDALEQATNLENERRADIAWRARSWPDAATSGAPPRRLLAAYMAGNQGGATGETPPVAETTFNEPPDEQAATFLDPPRMGDEVTKQGARAVLDSSRSARQVIKEALEDG